MPPEKSTGQAGAGSFAPDAWKSVTRPFGRSLLTGNHPDREWDMFRICSGADNEVPRGRFQLSRSRVHGIGSSSTPTGADGGCWPSAAQVGRAQYYRWFRASDRRSRALSKSWRRCHLSHWLRFRRGHGNPWNCSGPIIRASRVTRPSSTRCWRRSANPVQSPSFTSCFGPTRSNRTDFRRRRLTAGLPHDHLLSPQNPGPPAARGRPWRLAPLWCFARAGLCATARRTIGGEHP